MKTNFSCMLTLCAVGLSTLGFLGCSSGSTNPKTYPVSGVVTQAGKPLQDATVTFVPDDPKGHVAIANTDSTGTYKLTTFVADDGAVAGSYKVKVSKYDKPKVDPSEHVQNLSYDEEQKLYNPDAKPPSIPKNQLPKKFENEQTSGLAHTVADKATTFDIKL